MSGVTFDLSSVFRTVAGAIGDQTFLVWRDRRFNYAEFDARVDGFAHFLASAGLGCHTERDNLDGHELDRTISVSTCAMATNTWSP